ncbi:uncharacterized protein IUM83_09138 [Phytophthora cinnamomi]|uniref:uncharacterized protein n=1 Tax=Phytophthora cinnamomi TaxID=4785 RepID=UPI00355A4897|nr:hypothetical protein IUM83_09138 [Phytophthora cinnamomi]
MNSSDLRPAAPSKLDMNDAEQKASRVRLASFPVLEDDTDSFIYDDDGESNEGDANSELCMYIQRLEREKQELENEVQLLRDHDANQQIKLKATERRVEMLEASLKDALNASDAFRQEKDVVLALQASERERMASLVALLEEAQNRYEDAERARQSAIFKLSSLQASRADTTSQSLLPPVIKSTTTPRGNLNLASDTFAGGSLDFGERIEKYKRDIELLRQKLELTEEQAAERQKMAVSLALHEAQLDYSNVVEHMKLECERRLNDWRHDEAVRAKEKESAMDEDRYSIRLEMKHALQRSQIDQRVAYLQSQAEFSSGTLSHHAPAESDFSIGTLDEVLVRMQLEQVKRTASYFHRWRHQTGVKLKEGESLSESDPSSAVLDEEATQSLQLEIKKLHDQLSSSKSEAWRYKRQLLKQFL